MLGSLSVWLLEEKTSSTASTKLGGCRLSSHWREGPQAAKTDLVSPPEWITSVWVKNSLESCRRTFWSAYLRKVSMTRLHNLNNRGLGWFCLDYLANQNYLEATGAYLKLLFLPFYAELHCSNNAAGKSTWFIDLDGMFKTTTTAGVVSHPLTLGAWPF